MATRSEVVRTALTDIAVLVAVDVAASELTHRLRHGRAPAPGEVPRKRGMLRYLVGCVMAEFTEMAVGQLRWQRRRMAAAIDHAAAIQSATTPKEHRSGIPVQRSSSSAPLGDRSDSLGDRTARS